MFTGLVTHIGTVARIDKTGGDWKLFVSSTMNVEEVRVGASISCSGCCLTVIDKDQNWFAFGVSGETLSKTVIGTWDTGTRLNLESAMRLGDELGGHLVTGHVDGLATIQSITQDGDSHRLRIEVPDHLALYLAPKGSVALDGISLTVNEVQGNVFGVNIIPHTWIHTTLGEKKPGDLLNMEADLLARYVARQLGKV
ncbi:MAG: riboflavin synthase [Micavibrio sp.]